MVSVLHVSCTPLALNELSTFKPGFFLPKVPRAESICFINQLFDHWYSMLSICNGSLRGNPRTLNAYSLVIEVQKAPFFTFCYFASFKQCHLSFLIMLIWIAILSTIVSCILEKASVCWYSLWCQSWTQKQTINVCTEMNSSGVYQASLHYVGVFYINGMLNLNLWSTFQRSKVYSI